ncbi:unnamed protein product [Moneuplotes crassus]|uniref:Uncharacterized protein n=1 Tax=Euplotes crassus TaxID=5936 RepID=A0AAD1XLD2_EUPCR|nr:unnamed protein product [Moneuplotes crassus]
MIRLSEKPIFAKRSFEKINNFNTKESSIASEVKMSFRTTFQACRKPDRLDLPPLKIKKRENNKMILSESLVQNIETHRAFSSARSFAPAKTNVNFY